MSIKIGILILVRLGSTRLKNKHLIEVSGQSFLNILINRLFKEFNSSEFEIIIASSDNPVNRALEEKVNLNNSSIYYGSDANIPKRQYECALRHNLTHIVSVDGDDIFCSISALLSVIKELKSGTDGVITEGLPIGLNAMGYNVQLLKECLDESIKLKQDTFETGWGRIFNNKLKTIKLNYKNKEFDDLLRFTLDYVEDQQFLAKLIEQFPGDILEASDDDIIQFVIKEKLYSLNTHLKEEYMNNFNSQKINEIYKNGK